LRIRMERFGTRRPSLCRRLLRGLILSNAQLCC
jgi:hypothetical protein